MRQSEIMDRQRLIQAALGRIPCDLTICNVRLVNVLTGEIYPAHVDILDGAIARVREGSAPQSFSARQVLDGGGRYLLPGYIDTHMHVESTMLLPQMAARAIVPWGTTTICTDPHEIANVMGEKGVAFMLANGRRAALRQYVLAPSCVPAVPGLETAGASFDREEISRLLDSLDVVGVAELMDFMGVISGSSRMNGIMEEGHRRGVLLQGHAPQVGGDALAAYRIGGPATDHESATAQEIREKLRQGMRINLRASSIVDCLDELVHGLDGMQFLDRVSICTDDVHAGDLLSKGHVNAIVARLIEGGMPPVQAIRLATLNAAQEYGFDDLGAIAPGYMADMQLVDRLDGGCPYAVFIRGKMVAREGRYLPEDGSDRVDECPDNTMQVKNISGPQDFLVPAEGARDHAQVLVMGRNGQGLCRSGTWMELPVKDGFLSLEEHPELQFVSVVNRYGSGRKTVAVTRDFGLTEGAIASTVSHDSHNLTIVYRDPASAWACVQALCQTGGGLCAARDGRCISVLPLPVAGLMSLESCETLAPGIRQVEQAMQSLCHKPFSLLDISVYTLPAVPGLVLTDLGLVDSMQQTFVEWIRKD